MAGISFEVHGRVQGVGFRYFVRSEADKLGVAGWVRNTPQGTVEGKAYADSETLEAFRRKLSSGPPLSRVDRVDQSDIGEADRPTGFEIR